MIQAHFLGGNIVSSSSDAFSWQEKSVYGEKQKGVVVYAPVEALYLVGEGKMEVMQGKKAMDERTLLKKLHKTDKKIATKLAVYADLRNTGYIVKTALKFGAEFRVYDKGVRPGGDHAKWILYTSGESDAFNWHEFAAKTRVAHSTKKNLLLGVVDDEGDVTYYEIGWLKP